MSPGCHPRRVTGGAAEPRAGGAGFPHGVRHGRGHPDGGAALLPGHQHRRPQAAPPARGPWWVSPLSPLSPLYFLFSWFALPPSLLSPCPCFSVPNPLLSLYPHCFPVPPIPLSLLSPPSLLSLCPSLSISVSPCPGGVTLSSLCPLSPSVHSFPISPCPHGVTLPPCPRGVTLSPCPGVTGVSHCPLCPCVLGVSHCPHIPMSWRCHNCPLFPLCPHVLGLSLCLHVPGVSLCPPVPVSPWCPHVPCVPVMSLCPHVPLVSLCPQGCRSRRRAGPCCPRTG